MVMSASHLPAFPEKTATFIKLQFTLHIEQIASAALANTSVG